MTKKDLINKLEVNLKFTGSFSEEIQIKKKSNKIYEFYIQPALEKLFFKYGKSNIFIPHIELNIGNIKEEDIESAVYNSLERQFINHINNNTDNVKKYICICDEEATTVTSDVSMHKSQELLVTESRTQLITYLKSQTRPWYLTNDEFNLQKLIKNSNINKEFLIYVISTNIFYFFQLISITPLSDINKWIIMLEHDIILKDIAVSYENMLDKQNEYSTNTSKFIATYHLLSVLDKWIQQTSSYQKTKNTTIKESKEGETKNKSILLKNKKHLQQEPINENSNEIIENSLELKKSIKQQAFCQERNYNHKKLYLPSLITSLGITTESELKDLKDRISQVQKSENIDVLNEYTERLQKHLLIESEKESLKALKGKRILIENGGVVLFLPWLTMLFTNLEYLNDKQQFKSITHQERAVLLIQYLAGTYQRSLSPALFLNKIICGLPLLFPIDINTELTDKEKDECNNLIKQMIEYWPSVKGTSVHGIQETFILREGIIEPDNENWIIRIENKTVDILMNDIPWDFTMSALPWNKYLIYTEWKI